MNARIIALAAAALVIAAPLSAAEAGRLTDLAKVGLKANAKLAGKAVKGAARLAKKSIALNALVLKCAVKPDC